MIKTFKYKLYNSKRNKHIVRQIELASNIYNHCIALHKRYYRLFKKSLSMYELQKHITKLKARAKYKHWNNLNSQAIQDITERIDKAYKLFFRNNKQKIKSSPPNFKSRKKYKSYTLKQTGYKILDNNSIKLGNKIYKYFKDRQIQGKIKTITVKRDAVGDLFIIIVCDNVNSNPKSISMSGRSAGFDFGLKTFLTASDGNRIESPQFFKKNAKIIKKKCRNLSRKVKGSRNRRKARIELAKAYRKVYNQRRNYFFKLSLSLIRQYDKMFFEDLNLKGMQRLWGRKVSDYAFYEFITILQTKALEYGKIVSFINRYYPSSKACSVCGYMKEDLNLKDREWICPECNTKHDRDLNASINIYRVGASTLGVDFVRLSQGSRVIDTTI